MVGLPSTFPVYCLHVVGFSQTFPVSGLPLSHLLLPRYLRFLPEQRKSGPSSFSLQTGFRQNASTLILGIQSLPVHACSRKIFLWPLIENRSFLHICESSRINKDRHTRARKIRCKHVTADKHTGTANIHSRFQPPGRARVAGSLCPKRSSGQRQERVGRPLSRCSGHDLIWTAKHLRVPNSKPEVQDLTPRKGRALAGLLGGHTAQHCPTAGAQGQGSQQLPRSP